MSQNLMKHQAHIYNELKEVAPFLAKLEKTNAFDVPEDYFAGLHRAILDNIFTEQLPVLPAPGPLFKVPAGYFENLAEDILQKIKDPHIGDAIEELKLISPSISAASKGNIFVVPRGYFDNLPNKLLQMVRPPAKVVLMKKRSMVWNCAAAATITGVMAVSALWTGIISTEQSIFTADNETVPLNIKNALYFKNEKQISEGIADLSDADIIKYLETTGSKADEEALASGISEKELPELLDYLTDENTLQIFIDKPISENDKN